MIKQPAARGWARAGPGRGGAAVYFVVRVKFLFSVEHNNKPTCSEVRFGVGNTTQSKLFQGLFLASRLKTKQTFAIVCSWPANSKDTLEAEGWAQAGLGGGEGVLQTCFSFKFVAGIGTLNKFNCLYFCFGVEHSKQTNLY